MARTDQNESVIEKDLSDDNYMYVDELQKLTDEYVTDFNSSLIPKPIWRPFIESLFENYVTLDLDKKDKILVSNLDYLKDTALILASYEEEELGMCASYSLSVLIKNIIFVNSFSQINIYTILIQKVTFGGLSWTWWCLSLPRNSGIFGRRMFIKCCKWKFANPDLWNARQTSMK